MYSIISVCRHRCKEYRSIINGSVELTSLNGVLWHNFSKSTVPYAKMGHINPTMPLLGLICHPFGMIWHNLPLYKIWQLQLQPFLRYGWSPQNLKEVTWCNHAPFRDVLSPAALVKSQVWNISRTLNTSWGSQYYVLIEARPKIRATSYIYQENWLAYTYPWLHNCHTTNITYIIWKSF